MDTIRLLCRCPECGKESVLEGVDIAPVRPSEMHISTGVGLICAYCQRKFGGSRAVCRVANTTQQE